ncbi:MAG: glycoside hydrolase family 97 C-terminal domain-containing protein, partial [Acidobacteriota bacterium]
FSINFAEFLTDGLWTMESWEDGVNADRYGSDFRKKSRPVNSGDKISIHLAPGGGWAAVLSRESN